MRLTLRTASRPELIAWVLSFGPSARLRQPPELVRELRDATRRMAELYDAAG